MSTGCSGHDQPGQGIGRLHDELYIVRVMGQDRLYLYPEQGNLVISAVNAGSQLKVELPFGAPRRIAVFSSIRL
ncbi:hypothetical protein ACFLS8_02405 [Chloroflexota bacterium]